MFAQGVADQYVRRRADHGGQPAEQGAECQRHQQTGRRPVCLAGNIHNYRQHERGYGHVVHKRGEHPANGHEDHHQKRSPASGHFEQLTPENVGDTGAGQSAAQDKHRPDGNHRGIAEPGQRFLGRNNAGHRQGPQDKQGQRFQGNPFRYQQNNNSRQNRQDQYYFPGHRV
jgi:hypothetical protein